MNKIKLMVDIDEEVLKFINLHGFVREEDRNAVNHAFLSATPFTENDDVVSRREAMYAITQSELANENYTQTKIRVRDLDSVLPKREKGKWIWSDGHCECDKCGCNPERDFFEPCGLDGGSYVSEPMKYCPNCGAEME